MITIEDLENEPVSELTVLNADRHASFKIATDGTRHFGSMYAVVAEHINESGDYRLIGHNVCDTEHAGIPAVRHTYYFQKL